MSEENENLEGMNEAQIKNQRNIANNANAVRNVADIASRSSNPYAKTVGTAVKTADKISGGKASEAIGKGINRANKIAPGGRMAQGAINKMSESGTADRINKATSKRKSSLGASNSGLGMSGGSAVAKGRDNSFFSRKEVEEQASDGGGVSFKATVKVMKIALIAMAPILGVIVFCCLFVAASQIFLHAFSMGEADNASDSDVEETIKDNGSDDLDTEIKDDDENGTTVSYDYFIDDKTIKFRQSKLVKVNIDFNVDFSNKVEITRPNNEADLEDLYDFYPGIMDYNSVYGEEIVETFFLKLHYLYTHYKNKYNIHLDLPLLMATLSKQSSDMGIVFSSNIEGYGESEIALKSENERFDYGKVFDYKSSTTNSMYDMEVLAQNMASIQVRESCKDSSGKETNYRILKDDEIGTSTLTCAEGETYSATNPTIKEDKDKYREFLKEFLEKKYFINSDDYIESSKETNFEDVKQELETPKEEIEAGKSNNPNYAEGVTFIDGGFGSNIYYYNQKDYQDYYFSKDPYNLAVNKTDYCSLGKGDCYQSIASSGCGPTSMAIAVSTLLNEPHSPIELTAKVCANKGCSRSGTNSSAFAPTAKEYGLSVKATSDKQKISDALSSGNSIVIGLMGPGDFTKGGHYITLTAINSDGEVFVADCNKAKNNKWWSFSRVIEQAKVKTFWIVSR